MTSVTLGGSDDPARRLLQLMPQFRLPLLQTVGETGSPAFGKISGVLLRTDIVGFTSLTDQMLSSGSIGAEHLAEVVRSSIVRSRSIVQERGGDIVSVLGDGAVYLWIVADADVAPTTLHAIDAGLELQRRATETLRGAPILLRCSVAAGVLYHFEVGGRDGEWHAVLSGPALSSVIAAGLEARPGSLAVAPGAWHEVADQLHGVPARSGVMLVDQLQRRPPLEPQQQHPPVDVPEHLLRASIAPMVLAHCGQGAGSWTGEFRRITVAFSVMRHLEHARAEDALSKVHQATELVQQVVHGLQGQVHQIRSDEEGVTALCVFGLPPAAHEDDATRAVQAALTLHGRWADLGVTTSTGIATGRVFATVLGDSGIFTLVGPAMNLAARLMQLNSGVVCDRETLMAGRQQGRIAARELAPLTLKGKDEPVIAFAPFMLTGPARSLDGPGLVGRVAEKAALAGALRRIAAGKGSVIVIEGEPGIGKSALVADFLQEANTAGLTTSIGGGDETQHASPFFAWRPVLSAVLDLSGRSEQDVARRVTDILGGESGLAPLLSDALGIRLSDSPETLLLSGEARAATTRRLVVQLIRSAVGSSPQVIVLEDLHWLDSPSRALLADAVAARLQILFVVTTRRGGEASEETQRLLDAADIHLALTGLSPAATGQLVAAVLGATGFDAEAADAVLERTGGNPLFISEIVPVMRAARLLASANGVATLERPRSVVMAELDRSLSKVGAPATLEGIILARFDRLPARTQRALQLASVIGTTVDADVFGTLDKDHDEDSLAGLVREGFLERTEFGHYGFRHAVMRNVVYGSMSFADRRVLHLAYARAMASDPARASSAAVLGHHFREGGDDRNAATHLLEAAKAALRSYANVEAVAHAKAALRSIRRLRRDMSHGPDRTKWQDQKAEAQLALGSAYHRLSRYPYARRRTEAGLLAMGFSIPRGRLGLATGFAWQLLRQGLNRSVGARPPRAARRREQLVAATDALERMVEVHFFDGKELAAGHAAVRMLNFAERTGAPAPLALGYANFAGMASVIPAHGMARRYRQRALTTLAWVEDIHANTWGKIVIAGSMLSVGDFDEAGTLLTDAAATAERATDLRLWRGATELLAAIEASRGQWDPARSRVTAMLASADRDHDRRGRVSALRELALFSLHLGAFDDAARWANALADEVARGGVEVEEDATLVDLHTIRATVALESGDAVGALALAGEALVHLRRNTVSFPFYYWTMFLLARVFLAAWVVADAIEGAEARRGASDVRRAIARQARAQWIARPTLNLVDAAIAALAGRQAVADRHWQRAASTAAALRLPYEVRLAGQRGAYPAVSGTIAGLQLLPTGDASLRLTGLQRRA